MKAGPLEIALEPLVVRIDGRMRQPVLYRLPHKRPQVLAMDWIPRLAPEVHFKDVREAHLPQPHNDRRPIRVIDEHRGHAAILARVAENVRKPPDPELPVIPGRLLAREPHRRKAPRINTPPEPTDRPAARASADVDAANERFPGNHLYGIRLRRLDSRMINELELVRVGRQAMNAHADVIGVFAVGLLHSSYGRRLTARRAGL